MVYPFFNFCEYYGVPIILKTGFTYFASINKIDQLTNNSGAFWLQRASDERRRWLFLYASKYAVFQREFLATIKTKSGVRGI
jgi:hypothetical protein